MAELIEILNNTSPGRTVFYCAVAIIIIGILSDAICKIVKAIFKRLRAGNEVHENKEIIN